MTSLAFIGNVACWQQKVVFDSYTDRVWPLEDRMTGLSCEPLKTVKCSARLTSLGSLS